MNNLLKSFRLVSTLEALSYLILLLVAVPLKHMFGKPELVRIMGTAHGVLFVLYVIGAFVMLKKLNWSSKVFWTVLLCSIIPFGPFYVEKKYLPKSA